MDTSIDQLSYLMHNCTLADEVADCPMPEVTYDLGHCLFETKMTMHQRLVYIARILHSQTPIITCGCTRCDNLWSSMSI